MASIKIPNFAGHNSILLLILTQKLANTSEIASESVFAAPQPTSPHSSSLENHTTKQ